MMSRIDDGGQLQPTMSGRIVDGGHLPSTMLAAIVDGGQLPATIPASTAALTVRPMAAATRLYRLVFK